MGDLAGRCGFGNEAYGVGGNRSFRRSLDGDAAGGSRIEGKAAHGYPHPAVRGLVYGDRGRATGMIDRTADRRIAAGISHIFDKDP